MATAKDHIDTACECLWLAAAADRTPNFKAVMIRTAQDELTLAHAELIRKHRQTHTGDSQLTGAPASE